MGDSILLTGADGYVGSRLAASLGEHHPVVAVSRRGRTGLACDLLDAAAVDELARTIAPRAIVHAAGNKNIPECESSPLLAYDANVRTAANVLRAWPDVPMIYVSTDYVFPGTRGYYTEESPVAPLTAYGQSKLCAEITGRLIAAERFTSVRVSAIYDASAAFLQFLGREVGQGRAVECYVDSFYSPTYFPDFAAAILALIDSELRPAVVHVAGERISRYEFARAYAGAFGYDRDLVRPAELDVRTSTLCPDLSLASGAALATVGFVPTGHDAALREIASGAFHADAQPVSSLLRFPRPHAWRGQRRPVGGDQLHRDSRVVHPRGTLSSRHA